MTVSVIINICILSFSAKYALAYTLLYLAVFYDIQRVHLPFNRQLRLLERQGLAAISAHSSETKALSISAHLSGKKSSGEISIPSWTRRKSHTTLGFNRGRAWP